MQELRNDYLRLINIYRNELAVFTKEKKQLKDQNEFYPTRSLDVKIADRKKKLKEFMAKYEATYHV